MGHSEPLPFCLFSVPQYTYLVVCKPVSQLVTTDKAVSACFLEQSSYKLN